MVRSSCVSFPLETKISMDELMGGDQAPPSLGFSRQEHWSGLPFPPSLLHCK